MRLYNTLTKQKEDFVPIHGMNVGLYSCGPTVYNYPHIGNLRAYVFADTLHRWLEYNNYNVKHIVNITDVGHLTSDEDEGEDKLEKGAVREGLTAIQVAEKYTKAFMSDLGELNIEKADTYPKATEHINEQIDFITVLDKKGFTYVINDGVYFDTSKISDYGKLANLDIKGLKSGARIEANPEKRNITDFALWKLSPKNSKREMEWDSPWGKGFPGWHIECSAMSAKYLGEYFDIHTGGVDHIPVHHTNEIAQSEAVFGKPFVKYWMHNEFLLVNGKKMSKSLDNFYTLADLKKKFNIEPLAFRLLCLQANYREKLNFTDESIISAQNTLNNIRDFVVRLQQTTPPSHSHIPPRHSREGGNPGVDSLITNTKSAFNSALEDDLNMPKAMAVLFNFTREMNKFVIQGLSKKDAKQALDLIYDFDKVLGFELDKIETATGGAEVEKLLADRAVARDAKDWVKSDQIRTEIQKLDYDVEDTASGQILKKL